MADVLRYIMKFYPSKPTEPENAKVLITLGGAHKVLLIIMRLEIRQTPDPRR